MGAVGVVVRDVLSKDATQVVLAEHDHVVGDLPARSAHPSFGEPVLPRRPRRDSELRQTEVLDAAVERGSEDLVPVADQPRKPLIGSDGLDDLLCSPFGRRVSGDVHVEHAAPFEREHEECASTAKVTVGTVKKSIAIVPTAWVRMNVPHVWDGGRGVRPTGRGMYFATASWPTSEPSFANSFAILLRLHNGFSRATAR